MSFAQESVYKLGICVGFLIIFPSRNTLVFSFFMLKDSPKNTIFRTNKSTKLNRRNGVSYLHCASVQRHPDRHWNPVVRKRR